MRVQKTVKICKKVFQAKLSWRKLIFIASFSLETVEILIILSWIELEKAIFSKIWDFSTDC